MAPTVQFQVRLTPRGGRDAVTGWDGVTLQARVAAPPADGQANRALLKLLARTLDRPSRDIAIVRGSTAREKTVRVDGLSADALDQRLRARVGT